MVARYIRRCFDEGKTTPLSSEEPGLFLMLSLIVVSRVVIV